MKRFFFFLASFLYATIFTFGQCDHNLLLNSDFESSIRAGDNWVPTAQADISNDARSGQQAMRIDASPFVRIWQVFPATPGQEYTFSGYLKTTGAGGGIAISFLTADYQPNFEFLEFEPSNTYNKIELTRTALANTAWIQVLFIASPDAPLFADDFCLVEGDGSSSNCTISATVSNLFCNDAGTSEDPSDDEYGFDLEVSSTNGGSTFDFIVPSLNINIPRVYGSMPVNENKISDGIKTIILRDSSVPNCETTINVTPPATCSGGSGSGCGFNRSYTQLGNNPLKRLSASENIDGNFTIRVSEPTAGNDLNTLYYDISNSGDFIQRTSISSIPRNGIFFPDGGYYQAPFNVGTGLQLNIFDETNTQIAQGVVPVNPAVQSLQGFVSLRKIDGGYLGSMVVNQSNPTEFYLYAFEVDEQLNLKWSRLFPNQVSGAYSFRPLLLASDGGRYFLSNDSNFYSVFKLDNQGNELWNQGNFASAAIVFEGISESPNGLYIYTTDMGAALRGTGNFVNYFKYDAATGQEIWSVGAPSNRISDSGILGLDNGAITTYVVDSETFYRLHNENGDVVWERSIPGVHSVQEQTVDGGFLFAGINGASQAQLIKTTSNGELTPTCQMTSGPAELTIIGEPCPTNFPKQQQTVSVDFTIKNTGTIVSTAETIYLYRNTMGRQSNALQIGEVEVPSLAPNQQVNLTVSGVDNSPIPGSYLTTPGRPFTEYLGYFLSNERAQFPNNLKEIDYYCKKFNTDLELEITPVETGYDDSGEISFRLKLSNNGNEGASNIAVNFFEPLNLNNTSLNNILLSPDNIDFQSTSNGVQWVSLFITPGGYTETTITTRFTELLQLSSVPDNFIVNATVTSGHNLNTNTSNDSVSATFVKRESQGGDGNLVLTATGDSNIPQWSDGVAYFEITNRSGETFDNIQVRFDFDQNIRLMGGNQYTSSAGTTLEQSWTRNPVWNVGTMGAGEVKNVALNVYSITNSPMEIYAQISQATGNDVTSTPGNGTPPIVNEDDEVLWQINGGTLPNGDADLTISNLVLDNLSVKSGDVLNYNFDIANVGTANVPQNFIVRAYLSTDGDISTDDIQDGIVPTGNFDAGLLVADVPGASTINLPEGDYYLLLRVDADNQVNESDETNNDLQANIQFTVDNTPGGNGSACDKQIEQDMTSFNCIESTTANGSIKVVYNTTNGVIEKTLNQSLDVINTGTLPTTGRPTFVLDDVTLTKTNADGTVAYTRTVPQAFADRFNYRPQLIEFMGGYVFFGQVDSPAVQKGIRTDNNFNVLFEKDTPIANDPLRNAIRSINSVNGNNIAFISGSTVTYGSSATVFLWDANLNELDNLPLFSGAWQGGANLSENACNKWTVTDGVGLGYCKSGGCYRSERREVEFNNNSIQVNSYYGVEHYTTLGVGSEKYDWSAKTSDGGNISANRNQNLNGSSTPVPNDAQITFTKTDANGNVQWERNYLITDWEKVFRIYESAGTIYILKNVDGELLMSDLECYDLPSNLPDLVITDVNAPASAVEGSSFNLSYTLRNTGTLASQGSIVGLYLSRDQQLGFDAPMRNVFPQYQSINPDGSVDVNIMVTANTNRIGTNYLLLVADAQAQNVESDEDNNLIVIPIEITEPNAGGVDLEISTNLGNPSPAQWSVFTATVAVTNNGSETATGIEVEFRPTSAAVYQGGNEGVVSQGTFKSWEDTWEVGTLAPGEIAILDVNLFRTGGDNFVMYTQITAQNETENDSSPNNGVCCSPGEDDEGIIVVSPAANGVNNRSAIVENIGNQPFAIVNAMPNPFTDEFKLQVFSSENQESEITVMNAMGQAIFKKEVNLNEGLNTIPMSLDSDASGILMVKMTPFHPYLRQIRVMRVRD